MVHHEDNLISEGVKKKKKKVMQKHESPPANQPVFQAVAVQREFYC